MTAWLEQTIASCLKQSVLLKPTLAFTSSPFPCPPFGCANTHDPFSEVLAYTHTHTPTRARSHTHGLIEILYNQQLWGMKERLVNILQTVGSIVEQN